MQLTKFTHACVRFDDGERSLVIDPGLFSEVEQALDGVDDVLITHEHFDHVDAEKLRAAAKRNSRLRVRAPASVAASFTDLGDQMTTVAAGESLEVAGFAVRTFGGQHALLHPQIPVVANVGYLVSSGAATGGGAVYHPGDSFVVPDTDVSTLLLPLSGPWCKLAEMVDFAIAVRAPRVHQVHDALLSDLGVPIIERNIDRLAAPHGVTYTRLEPAQAVDV